jgi:MFS family permease
MGVSMHSLVRRIPKALGPLAGGFFLWRFGVVHGIRIAFLGALILSVVAVIVQTVLIEDDRPARRNPILARFGFNPRHWVHEMSPSLRNLLVSDILIRFCEQIPDAFVVVWATRAIAAPVNEFQFGVLTVIEMATAVVVYIPVAYYADRMGKKPFVAATFVFFTLFPLTLLFSQSFWPLVGAFILRGLKEFGEPTRKALIMDLAAEDAKAVTFGAYYLIRDVIVSIAAFGGGLLWDVPRIGPVVNLLTAFGFGIIGTAWFIARGRDVSFAPREG